MTYDKTASHPTLRHGIHMQLSLHMKLLLALHSMRVIRKAATQRNNSTRAGKVRGRGHIKSPQWCWSCNVTPLGHRPLQNRKKALIEHVHLTSTSDAHQEPQARACPLLHHHAFQLFFQRAILVCLCITPSLNKAWSGCVEQVLHGMSIFAQQVTQFLFDLRCPDDPVVDRTAKTWGIMQMEGLAMSARICMACLLMSAPPHKGQ